MYFLILAVAIFHCSEAIEICELPVNRGTICMDSTKSSIRLALFNGRCQQFAYKGCGGNQNNFLSLRGCVETCRVSPCPNCKDDELCKIGIFDDCTPPFCFVRGKCIKRTAACAPSKDTGMCKGSLPHFFYSVKSGMCEKFNYGDCGSSNNRFETRGSCEVECEDGLCKKCNDDQICKIVEGDCDESDDPTFICPVEVLCTDICSLPKDTGPCRGFFPNLFYNVQSGKCEELIYGGCGGNENRFESIGLCEEACEGYKTEPSLSRAPCKMN